MATPDSILSARSTRAGQRPRAWLTILWLALSVSPARALRGLWWVLRGKRVRGWNMLYVAAADHPAYYDAWVKHGEPRVIETFLAERAPQAQPPKIACLILGIDAVAARRTLDSVRAALGPATQVWSDCAGLGGVKPIRPNASLADTLAAIDPSLTWILPLRAGDGVARTVGEVLRHAVPPTPDSAIIFWDQDIAVDGGRRDPWIKPDFDPLLFAIRDGLTGAGLILTAAARAVAAEEPAAASDMHGIARLIVRILAEDQAEPLHIPLILTHRAQPTAAPTTANYADAHVTAPLLATPIAPLLESPIAGEWPVVSIIIPTRDRADLLERCLAGLDRLAYPGAIELLIVDNDSVQPATFALFERVIANGAKILPHPGDFNYAALINQAVSVATGDMLCLLNNDIELLDGEWLTHMVRYALLDGIGAVGARLLFPDRTIQHVGIAIGIGEAAGHVQKGVDPTDPRFAQWHGQSRIVSAVTGACLVVRRASFEAAGGMDADGLAIDFNDVDLCLKLRSLGLSNVLCVEATLIHQESVSRGSTPLQGTVRFDRELALLRARWNTVGFADPHYSPLFRRECQRCVLSF